MCPFVDHPDRVRQRINGRYGVLWAFEQKKQKISHSASGSRQVSISSFAPGLKSVLNENLPSVRSSHLRSATRCPEDPRYQ